MKHKPNRVYHPLDLGGPKPGTPEYEKNFDDWYDQTYGYGLGNSGIASAMFAVIVAILIIIAIAIPVMGIRHSMQESKQHNENRHNHSNEAR